MLDFRISKWFKVGFFGVAISVVGFQSSVFSLSSLTLDMAFQKAAQNSQEVQIQVASLQGIEAQKNQVKSALYPRANLELSESFQDNSIGGNSPFTASSRPDYRIRVQQPIFTGFREWDQLQALDAQLLQQQQRILSTKRVLYSNVIQAYYEVARTETRITDLEDALRMVELRIKELANREYLGKSRRSERLDAESEWNTLKAQMAQAQAEKSASLVGLSRWIGEPLSPSVSVAMEVEIHPFSTELSFWEGIVEQRPELIEIQSAIKAQYWTKQQAQHALMPTLTVGGNYYLRRVQFLEPIKWDFNVVATLPLFDGGQSDASVQFADSQLNALQQNYERLKKELTTQLIQASIRNQAQFDQLKWAKIAFDKSRESYQLHVQEYRSGLENHLQVIQALRNLLDFKQAYNTIDIALRSGHAQLKMEKELIQ